MRLISAGARQILDSPPSSATEADLITLREEVTSSRRLAGGAAAVVLGLLGGLGAGFTGSELSAGRGGGALVASALALVLLVPAAGLGLVVARAGHRVVTGYVVRRSGAAATSPGQLVRSVLGPGLVLRSALAAGGVIGSCFAASVLWLGATASPVDGAGLAMGAVWLVTTALATALLLTGELRVVRAEGRRTRP